MALTDLVFSRPTVTPGAGGVALLFGEADLAPVLRALVLKMGLISASLASEAGLYPALRLAADGSLRAGGAGINLVVVAGVVRQVAAGESSAA